MNPRDNIANIDAGYLERLQSLPARQRQRFLEGQFLTDIEGALWTFDMITHAQNRPLGKIRQTAIGLDPSGAGTATSDECGIVVACSDMDGGGHVLADYSLRGTPAQWGQAVVNAYHKHQANFVIYENNYGGKMAETIIKQIDPSVKCEGVPSRVGKLLRAEPVSHLYEMGKIGHAEGLDELERQMQEFVPMTATESPDRMDGAVIVLSRLLNVKTPQPSIRIA
jgi:phage terminase large subunit-like protein